MSDKELLDWHWIEVSLDPQDMPGRPLKRVACERCGEHVQDTREVHLNGRVLCKACAKGGYYKYKNPDKDGKVFFLLSDVM